MAIYGDYSAGRPGGKALRDNGFVGAIRYIGLGSAGKRLTAAEYQDLVANGITVLLVVEYDTHDAWGTDNNTVNAYWRGRANAQIGLDEARAIGVPDWVGMAAAADAHAAFQLQIDCAVQYARGFRDVLGQARTGFYGFFETLNAVHADNAASWYWRCGAEPSTLEKQWVNFWQRNYGETVRYPGGVATDINEVYHTVAGGSDMFEQPDRDLLVALKNVLVNQRHSLVPTAGPNDNFDTGQYVQFIDNATNQTFKKADEIKADLVTVHSELASVKADLAALKAAIVAPAPPTVDLDALALKVAAQLKSLTFKA